MKKLISSLALILSLLVIYPAYRWATNPQIGTTTNTQSNSVLGEANELKNLSTGYFSTVYPSNLVLKTNDESTNGPIFGQYLFVSKEPKNQLQIGITVGQLETITDDVSQVQMRDRNPARFTETSRPYAPIGAKVYEDKIPETYALTVVWPVNDYYFSITGSGAQDQKATIDEYLEVIISAINL